MPKQARIFYAYPHHPSHVGETISSAATKLKGDGVLKKNNVRFRLWADNTVSGKPLLKTVLGQIDRSHIFACDLTYPNPNVNFELGYAIARFKRIFATLDPSVSKAERDFQRIYFSLLHMGYVTYDNHESLAQSFLQEKPWTSLDKTLLDDRYRRQLPRLENPTLLYVKPPWNSDSVIAIQEEFKTSLFSESIVVDDPNEYSSQILEWYIEKIMTADAVVVHLLSSSHVDNSFHNLRASIVAGLAQGLRRPMIMLAHAPYEPPVDYEKWLSVHETAAACVATAKSWLNEVSTGLTHQRARRQYIGSRTSRKMELRSLFLGDLVAEHEAHTLYDYFVETSSFYQAMDNPLTILLGRRGTGKTAILYAISSEMNSTTSNHVTILKPVGYETHGLIRVVEEIRQHSERGFLIESLWKYLIYSEIANSVATKIRNRPVYQERTAEEKAFLDYCDNNETVLRPPFSERIESAVLSLEGVGGIVDAREQRLRISEKLHSSLIGELRRHLGIVLATADSLTLLIDGLDDPWGPGEHVHHLAELIGGLLSVVQYIPSDFRRSSSRLNPVNTKVTLLLRSDIFAFIQHLIPEQDKLPIVRVTWDNEDLLLRVLEERMLHGAPRQRNATDIWEELFPAEVVGLTCPDFILRTVLPRPRDLIHLVNGAVTRAINRGSGQVSQDDFLAAREQYSRYAFDSILKEDDPDKGKLEEVLYEFAGVDTELKLDDIESLLKSVGVESTNVEFYLNLLCDINFLGIETATGFRYSGHEEERRSWRNVARVLATRNNRSERFAINPTFYQVLQIE